MSRPSEADTVEIRKHEGKRKQSDDNVSAN